MRTLTTADNYDMVPMEEKEIDPCGVKLDTDNIHHMSWIYNHALERAVKFNIEGVTFSRTQKLVSNIIPTIASTNALISAVCVNEAFKVLSWASFALDNYFMYMGNEGIYSRTFEFKRNPQCPVCKSHIQTTYELDPNTTFEALKHKILADANLKLKYPSIATENNKLLWMNCKLLRSEYEHNLKKPICQLFESKTVLLVADTKVLGRGVVKICIIFKVGAFYVP